MIVDGSATEGTVLCLSRWPNTPVARWEFEGVEELSPRLFFAGSGESRVDPAEFRARVEETLRTAPAAWDPYAVSRPR